MADPDAFVPPRPTIDSADWGDWPHLMISDRHLSIGWQNRPARKGGPCYLVGRRSVIREAAVVERFPFTDAGWAKAWRSLHRSDKTLEGKLREMLADRAAAERHRAELEALDSAALVNLPAVIYLGGYAADADFRHGEPYDLRFLVDRLTIAQHQQTGMLIDLPYRKVTELEVGGPGIVSRMSRAGQAGMTLAFGLVGAALAYTDTKIQTIVRAQATGCELHFLCTTIAPDALRIQLSRPLGAIRDAQSAEAPAVAREPGAAAAVGELTRLASLLDAGLLTREEFDRLKARLLAGG